MQDRDDKCVNYIISVHDEALNKINQSSSLISSILSIKNRKTYPRTDGVSTYWWSR
jgi:hypothetical protein